MTDTRDRIRKAAREGWDASGDSLIRWFGDICVDIGTWEGRPVVVVEPKQGRLPIMPTWSDARELAAQLVAVADAMEPEPIVLFHMPDFCPECGERVTQWIIGQHHSSPIAGVALIHMASSPWTAKARECGHEIEGGVGAAPLPDRLDHPDREPDTE